MKKIWVDPQMVDLSVGRTEAQKSPNGIHDGIIYDGTPIGWKEGIEGHS